MSANVTTLNQVIQNLKSVADCHDQLHSFKFGDPWEFYTSGVATCAEQWVQIQPAVVTRNTIKFSFRTWLLDAVKRGEANELDVQSDMTLVAQDLVARYKHPDYNWNFGTDQRNTLNYFTEYTPYQWSGVWFDFTIELMYPSDTCRIPFSTQPTIYPQI